MPIISPLIQSALQDPTTLQPGAIDSLKRNVNSHKSCVNCIKWLPNTVEFDKRNFHNILSNTSSFSFHLANEISQFISFSTDGQFLFWDMRLGDKDPRKTHDTNFIWRANYGAQLFRPEIGGMLGGSVFDMKRNQKDSRIVGGTDEGDVFEFDWTARPTEENPKLDMITKLWDQDRDFRPAISVEKSPFFDDIVLAVHDFYFTIWRSSMDLPLYSSMFLKGTHITCGCFSPTRPGVVVIGRNDGYLDFWDFLDQSHKFMLQHQVVSTSIGISTIRFCEQNPALLAVGDFDGTLHMIELPYTIVKKIVDEEILMQNFWDREQSRVEYVQKRNEIREVEMRKRLEERLKREQDESKNELSNTTADEDDGMEKEYQEYLLTFLTENGMLEEIEENGGEGDNKK